MPDWLAVVLLGIIEGVTEFLPISSTGHLLLAENSGLLPAQSELFNVVIQAGAVVAVLAVFSRRVKQLLGGLGDPAARDYLAKLAVAFAITGAGGLLAKRLGFALPKDIASVAWVTLVGGIAILAIERLVRGSRLDSRVTWVDAVAVGLAQILAAVFPGTSRSASTILVGMLLGLSRPSATEFSFLLGIPTLLAASALEIAHEVRHPAPVPTDWAMVALGTAVSAVTAFLVVRWLLRWVQTHTFSAFGWYRIALGVLMLAWAATR
jgi:undecaprenyl-diphosphatase